MISWRLIFTFIFFSGQLFAQEQMTFRLNEKGIIKVLQLALQYNSSVKSGKTAVIPQNLYKFTIKKEALHSNPIIPVVNEISDLNMNRDLDFFVNTAEISISGEADEKSLKSVISNSHEEGFDLSLSIDLEKISANVASISLCEDKERDGKNCGTGLKASLKELGISTKGTPVTLNTTLRIRTDGGVARVSVISVKSNLEEKNGPDLDIIFKSIEVPKMSIIIDGQETELDTSKLKEEILKRKSFLAQKLMAFGADFISNDLAEMVNVYLINKEIATSYLIYKKDHSITFNEFLSEYTTQKPYVRPPLIKNASDQEKDPMTVMGDQISEVISKAQIGVALKKITTHGNKDVELSGILDFMLNGRSIKVKNTFGNSRRTLPALNLTPYRNADISLAISEPLINGALDTISSTGLFQEMLESAASVDGVSIKNVKLHFTGGRELVAVVNAQIDLKELKADGYLSRFKNAIASYLERNNNNSVIYFPLEITIIPFFKQLRDGGVGVDLTVISPFIDVELRNRFNYPSNLSETKNMVREGVMGELKKSLAPHVHKTYSVDLTKFLNKAGVTFKPKSILLNQGAYFQINMDIEDIKFNSFNPNKR